MKTARTLIRVGLIASLVLYSLIHAAYAAEMPPLDPNDPRLADRQALRDLLVATEKAFNKLDVEAVIRALVPDAVIVWQDSHRSLSHDDVREHYKRTFQGAGAILKSVDVKATLGGPARFYGDEHAVAYGTTRENYELVGGVRVAIDGLWTADMVKRDGKWLVATLHFSTNPFDNDILQKAKRLAWILGGVGLLIGLVAGWLSARWRLALRRHT